LVLNNALKTLVAAVLQLLGRNVGGVVTAPRHIAAKR
jgi:hypothetical protein